MDEKNYMLALRSKLQKPIIFIKRNPIDIHTNSYGKFVSKLWQANSDAQFIIDPYAIASYYTSYLTKIDKNVTQELQTITFQHIQEIGNAF
jgi:hypothetical protein